MRKRRGALGSARGEQKARPGAPGLKVPLVLAVGFSCSLLIPCVQPGVTREPEPLLPALGCGRGFPSRGHPLHLNWGFAVLQHGAGRGMQRRGAAFPLPLLASCSSGESPGPAVNSAPCTRGMPRTPSLPTVIPCQNLHPEETQSEKLPHTPPPKIRTGSWHPWRPNTHRA